MNFEDLLKEKGVSLRTQGRDGIFAINCEAQYFIALVRKIKDKLLFDALADIASVDMGETFQKRFACVYHFFSYNSKKYLRVAVYCEDNLSPSLPSLDQFFGNANWLEREAFDMMGIKFEGHSDLRKILMWDAYPYNPLRKDFPLAGKDAPIPETYEILEGEQPMKVCETPMEGGPFHSASSGILTEADKEPRSRKQI